MLEWSEVTPGFDRPGLPMLLSIAVHRTGSGPFHLHASFSVHPVDEPLVVVLQASGKAEHEHEVYEQVDEAVGTGLGLMQHIEHQDYAAP